MFAVFSVAYPINEVNSKLMSKSVIDKCSILVSLSVLVNKKQETDKLEPTNVEYVVSKIGCFFRSALYKDETNLKATKQVSALAKSNPINIHPL